MRVLFCLTWGGGLRYIAVVFIFVMLVLFVVVFIYFLTGLFVVLLCVVADWVCFLCLWVYGMGFMCIGSAYRYGAIGISGFVVSGSDMCLGLIISCVYERYN